ncbi:hypothetical protein [Desulfurobacterium sp.]|uniref:type III-A CRISPR-associated RAMP protein Csm4 n=1 Tax=Desulfurobacterium sp. TaxID=2004706 RepID=UPI0026099620|nr:hypothetical protein [Desulfurobacterium sp.]
MKLAEITIIPASAFGTPLKGDTIFGHFCWQLVYDENLINGSFSHWIDKYSETPFAVFSSAYPKIETKNETYWLLKKPSLPLHFFGEEGKDCFEKLSKRKEQKSKTWVLTNTLKIDLSTCKLKSDKEAFEFIIKNAQEIRKDLYFHRTCISINQTHNSINRYTFSTGENFAPFITETIWFMPGIKLSIFVLYNENALNKNSLKTAFERIGKTGYGRDATWGMGRFKVEKVKELPLPEKSNCIYTLSPFVPKGNKFKQIWFQPVVRFGKHGSYLANSSNPFKEPILMADEGAVIVNDNPIGPLIGKAVLEVSKALRETVVQGYSIAIPFSFGGSNAKNSL